MKLCGKFHKILSLLLFLLSGFGNLTFSQSIEWSNSRKLKGGAVFTRVLGENSYGIYLMRYRNRFFTRSVVVEKYRNHLGYSFSRNILLKKSRLLSLELVNDDLLFFTTGFDRASQNLLLQAQWYDANVLPKSKVQVLAKVKQLEPYDKGDFAIHVITGIQSFALYHTSKSDNGYRQLHLYLLDPKLNVQKSKILELPIFYEDYQLMEFNTDRNGHVFVLTREKPKNSRKNESLWSPYRLFVWNTSTDEFSDYRLNDSATYLHQVRLSVDELNNALNITGLWSNSFPESIKGIYLCRLDLTSENKAVRSFTEMPLEIMRDLIGEKQANEKMEAYDFEQLRAIPMSNGQITVILERTTMSSEEDIVYVNGIPQNTSRNIYNFDEVLLVCLDSNGQIQWHNLINKSQSSLNDGGYYSSVITMVTKDRIHLIFNDKMRNSGNVLQYSVSGNGQMVHQILLHSDREFISVIPSESKQISAIEMLVPSMKDKKFALLKLIY